MPRRNLDDLLALLWGVGGLVVAGYFLYLALGPGSLESSRLPLSGLAAVALVGFWIVAFRHARRARETRAQQDSGPVSGWRLGPGRTDVPTTRRAPAEPPELSPSGRAELARIVGIADRAGLFAPRAPRPVDLMETAADHGEPVTLQSTLAGIPEADHWRPDFRPDDHLDALAFHDSQTEQLPETLTSQVEDLARLLGDDLPLQLLEVGIGDDGRTRMRLRLGDDERTLDYLGAGKALSTVLHATVARALHRAHPEGPRLAWLWSDQGVWLAVLRTTTVEALNADLGRALEDPWQWVDEQPPTAAGDVIRRSRGRG